MSWEGPPPRALYKAYRRELLETRAISAIRSGALVVLTTNVAFIALDWYLYPAHFWSFLVARSALSCMLVLVSFWWCHRYPTGSQILLGSATGALLLYVIFESEPLGGYYVGLMLLFSGLPMLLPLSTWQNLMICGGLWACYAVFSAAGRETAEWQTYGMNNLFLASAAFISVANCQQLNRSRFRDFLQRRQLEEARDHLRELDRQKSRFTANVHHELRTPLTLMLAPLDTMLAGDLGQVSDNQRQYLQTMRENGLRLLKLINQLLDLARIESQQRKVERQPLEPGRLAERILESARPLAERKGVRLEGESLEGLPVVRADADALEKVLVNLLGNALKFTDRGGVIRLRGQARDGGVLLEVEDSGIGIPPEQLDRVFDRFAQVDGSATRKHEGTGIGLALVKELVELHGGWVEALSEGEDRGSRFRAFFPHGETDTGSDEEVVSDPKGRGLSAGDAFAAVGAELGIPKEIGAPEAGDDYRMAEMRRSVDRAEAAEESAAAAGPALAEAGRPDGPEVLVVEDNADMRRLLAFILGREFRVRLAVNGRRALDAVREHMPDLVLSDVMMPEMSGLELCSALKGDEATRAIPVVLVTSKAEREMKIEGLERGADDYVTKPFHPRELLARVRNLVRLHWLQEELAERNAGLEKALRELKEAEVQLVRAERLAAVGELAAGVAHEVNNPVNFALNALRTLRRAVGDVRTVVDRAVAMDLGDRAKLEGQLAELRRVQDELGFEELAATLEELVGIVTEGLERTSRLVGNLRDFAQPGRGPQARVDVQKGLLSTVQLLRRAAADVGATVEVHVPGALPSPPGDAGALNQVFLNLLKNALEAFDRPGGTVRIEAAAEGPELRVSFRDDGPGMDADVQKHLFDPFFTTKEAGRGTGLGLSISRRIAEEHGGRLEVHSAPGEGSTFTLMLPLRLAQQSSPEGPHAC